MEYIEDRRQKMKDKIQYKGNISNSIVCDISKCRDSG